MSDIYQELRSRILNEIITPGQKISEIKLAEEFNCSRTPIRDVLKRLELDGLVVIKPKSGTYVKTETTHDVVEIMQVRSALERLAYMQACENAGEREIKRLEKLKKEMDTLTLQEPIDMMKFAQVHYEFHYHIICISRNELLKTFFERLNLRSSHMFYKMMDRHLAEDTQIEHQKIIDNLKNRDLEGADFMENHLHRKINRYLSEN
jgi:DNA-binding GntR family transcriptional regulator